MTTQKTRLLVASIVTLLLMLTAGASGQIIGRNPARIRGFQPSSAAGDVAPLAGGPKWTLTSTARGRLDLRITSAAVYDAPTNSMIMFGGEFYADVTNDVKLLSNANGIGISDWVTVIPNGAPGSPPARAYHSAVYDAANSRMIVYGGCSFTGLFCTTFLNDVWVLTNANGVSGTPTWVQLSPAGSPPPLRWGQAVAYDPVSNRLIIFGGDNTSVFFSDIWVLSNANGLGGTPAWSQLTPSGAPPTGVDFASVVYDATNNVLIEFAGGSQSGQQTNSVWTLSHANGLDGVAVWTSIIPNGAAGSPPKRNGHIAVYDSANNRMTIFGGDSGSANAIPQLNDVWVLANANGLSGGPKWSKLSISGTKPGPRQFGLGVYDPASNRLIIHGGGSSDGGFFSPWVLTGANGLP